MKADLNSSQTSFGAKVSPYFKNFMRSYINSGENRIKNNYRLNQKLAEIENFGYDDYMVNLVRKNVSWGTEYSLVATKEGQDIKEGIFLLKRNSARLIIDKFLSLKKRDFCSLIRANRKYWG